MQSQQKNTRYLNIERKRLKKLLHEWFELEKNRPPFQVIACEEEHEASLDNLHFKLRIDRIDQLENGEKFIIDYKTGKNNQIKAWFGDRPDEPQLPLYCVAGTIAPTAIAFAELDPSRMALKYISKETLSKFNYDNALVWDEQIAQWREVLTRLGKDFQQGIASIDPKNPSETCNQCHLHSLCRIYETYE